MPASDIAAPVVTGAQPSQRPISTWIYAVIAIALIACVAAILLAMGRTPICKCGAIKLWIGVVNSPENSQQLTDWYTFSHIIHGFLFYAGLRWLARIADARLSVGALLIAAITLEGAWEIFENTDMVINRYRSATIALDYYGDSVLNSVSDIAAMVVGFLLAARLPAVATVALALTMEIGVGLAIRDNLTLNVIMLVWPMDWIKAWQAGS